MAVQWAALAVGLLFFLAGVLGFIPGFTMNYQQMAPTGLDSRALLLGSFPVSIAQNIIHLVFGVAGLVCWMNLGAARSYLRWGAVVYLLLWVLETTLTRPIPSYYPPHLHVAGHWVWPAIAVGMFALSFLHLYPRAVSSSRTGAGVAH
ncbi:DUF4383 domain-containing protein [Brevibacterium daeguense]|uniref:DUF4383 domain-containing protein n=1 Tax=Brevibacterium daeguense TaxID=909936 RepID=A0ABP8EHK4_9MICO|nr:DUF4383 domain-containing protein [Brevibacterium daeguense]